jgi:hypothetical protein
MMGPLAHLIAGHRKALLCIDAVQYCAEGGRRRVDRSVIHLDQRHEERRPFDQRANRRCIASALNQIALPVAGNGALLDLRWAQMD